MPIQVVIFSRLTWPSSKPPTLLLFHGILFNSPTYQTVLREQLRQGPILLDINLQWRWRRTISISWAYRGYRRAALRFSLFTVCSNPSGFFPSINFFFFLFFLISLILATRSTINGKFPNHPWKSSFFLPRCRRPT